MAARCSSTTDARRDALPRRGTAAGDLAAARHGASPEDRRHAEHALLGGRRLGQHRVADAGVARHVGAPHVLERVRVRGGRHVGEVERLDVGGVLEDRGQLRREGVDLLVGQLQPSQLGHVGHLIARQRSHRAGHRRGGPGAPEPVGGGRSGPPLDELVQLAVGRPEVDVALPLVARHLVVGADPGRAQLGHGRVEVADEEADRATGRPSSEPVTARVVPSGRAKTSASMPRASAGATPRTSRTNVAIGARRREAADEGEAEDLHQRGSRHILMRLGPSGSGISPASTKPWRR